MELTIKHFISSSSISTLCSIRIGTMRLRESKDLKISRTFKTHLCMRVTMDLRETLPTNISHMYWAIYLSLKYRRNKFTNWRSSALSPIPTKLKGKDAEESCKPPQKNYLPCCDNMREIADKDTRIISGSSRSRPSPVIIKSRMEIAFYKKQRATESI